MSKYNLKPKQFDWLLKLVIGGDDVFQTVPWDLRKRAAGLLKSVGYVREYNSYERNLLLELRDDYIRWKQITDLEDDLPF
jgi:hypothetical protein